MSNLSATNSSEDSASRPELPRGKLRRVFVGKNGIRAGWSALIFLSAFWILQTSALAILGRFVSLDTTAAIPLKLAALQESCQLLVVFAATLLMARIESRPVPSYGYKGDKIAVRFVSGLVWGLFCISLMVAILWRAGFLGFEGLSLSGLTAFKYALAWALVFIMVGLFEESLLRGYLQQTLSRGIGFWPGAVLLSVLFAAGHAGNNNESLLGLVEVGAGGLVFCASLWYTGSLWWAVGFHTGWDWGQSFLYGTPDSGLVTKNHLLSTHLMGNPLWSGGLDGPEASVLMLPFVILIGLGIWVWWGKRKRADTHTFNSDSEVGAGPPGQVKS